VTEARAVEYVGYRRAIEALRAGVPNRDAVRALDSLQPHVEDLFRQRLAAVRAGAADDRPNPGLLIAGDFGSGKSHLLEHLQLLALDEDFVCSRIVISKETPLYDPVKLFRAAIATAVVPGKMGSGLTEIAANLESEGAAYAALAHWAGRPDVGLSSRFAASLFLYRRVKDPEIRDRLAAFWAGDPLNVSQMRSWLRAQGEAATYKLERVRIDELATQRFLFVPRLMMAAGYAGWVLLVDELELIGRYSFKQRARSYAALASWVGRKAPPHPGMAAVFAITADFDVAVLQDRNDLEAIPGKLRASEVEADRLLAGAAEQGMRAIARDVVRLKGPDQAALDHIRRQLRDLHARAYDWAPPEIGTGERLSTTRLRQYVRRWITEWDLARLYPGHTPDIVEGDLELDYSERPELEAPPEPEPGDH
jgi:P-loop Domain of unknown function (DUF2791)